MSKINRQNMNLAILQRFHNEKVSFWNFQGWWDHPKIFFIAPPWKNNEKDTSHIPAGLYNVIKHNSQYHPNTFEFLNVPFRSNILIHPGNYACDVMIADELHKSESLGCFMPGFDYDLKSLMIRRSVKAMEYLLENIKDNWSCEVKI